MSATAIKNSILVLLIILILHYLIKNNINWINFTKDTQEQYKNNADTLPVELEKYFVTSEKIPSTCDAPAQQLIDAPKKDIKAECDIHQNKKNMMILKEYEKEAEMNTFEPLYNDVQSFDNYDLIFAQYTSETCPKTS